jgi:gas vesicle protein
LGNDRFVTGLMTGVALGALVAMAMSPQVRGPVMNGASELGERMQKMWRKKGDMVEEMMPEGTM